MTRELRKIRPIRLGVAIGTAVVIVTGVALVCLAFTGSTFWLGSKTDRATVVTVVLTFNALLSGAVAAVLALIAYWTASGEADLSIEVQFNFCEVNRPRFKVLPVDGSAPGIPLAQFKQLEARVVIRNVAKYAARNPSVEIKLTDMAVPGYEGGWEDTAFGTTVGVTAFLWDGGADRMIHGQGARKLPDLSLWGGYIFPDGDPKIEITAYADGIKPVRLTLPVVTYTKGTPGQPETQSWLPRRPLAKRPWLHLPEPFGPLPAYPARPGLLPHHGPPEVRLRLQELRLVAA